MQSAGSGSSSNSARPALRCDDPSVTSIIRDYLDGRMYSYLWKQLPPLNRFYELHQEIHDLNDEDRVLCLLFVAGAAVSDAAVRSALPTTVFESLVGSRLLLRDSNDRWTSAGVLIYALFGLYIVADSLPTSPMSMAHPTPGPTEGVEYSDYIYRPVPFVADAIPTHLDGARVLDICSGSGFQGLVSATRGAASVVGLELEARASSVARFNAALNGLANKADFRTSDGLAALRTGEKFDFVVCNSPGIFLPRNVLTPEGSLRPPHTWDQFSADTIEQLPSYLSENGRGIYFLWHAAGYKSQVFLVDKLVGPMLKRHGISARVLVQKSLGITVDFFKEHVRAVAPGSRDDVVTEKARACYQALASIPTDGLYLSAISFWRSSSSEQPTLTSLHGPDLEPPKRS